MLAARTEREMGKRGGGEIVERTLAQIFFRDTVVVGADKARGERCPHARTAAARMFDDALDQREARSGDFAEHGLRVGIAGRVVSRAVPDP